MSRIRMWGAEAGSIESWPGGSYGPSITVTALEARTGTYSALTTNSTEALTDVLPVPLAEVYCRWAIYPIGLMSGNPLGGNKILHVQDDFIAEICDLRMQFATGVLALFDAGGNLLETGVIPLAGNKWQVLEFYIRPGLAAGRFRLDIDGVTSIDFTGNLGNDNPVSVLHWGYLTQVFYSTLDAYWDDYAVNDVNGAVNNSWCGRGGLEWLYPVGVGNTTMLTPVGAANGWQATDERPPDDAATYVESNVVDDFDTYELVDPSLTGDVRAAKWYGRAALSEPGAGSVAAMLRTNGADVTGTDQPITDTWLYRTQTWEQNPVTGVDWTLADLIALEAGVKAR